jgi:acrylyl-CoA reductase (NADPH)
MLHDGHGRAQASLAELDESQLPPHEVLIDAQYSSLNYKDGLAISDNGKFARKLPMACGSDLVGAVVDGGASDWRDGASVIATG